MSYLPFSLQEWTQQRIWAPREFMQYCQQLRNVTQIAKYYNNNKIFSSKHLWVIPLVSTTGMDAAKKLSLNGPGQTVQTQIRLFLEEQSDQGLHCLLHISSMLSYLPFSILQEWRQQRTWAPREYMLYYQLKRCATITKTRPCNIQRFFTAVKMTIFSWIYFIFIFLLKTYIVGTR